VHSGTHTFVEGGAGDAAVSFGSGSEVPAGSNPAREPVLVYPSNETFFPIDLAGVRFEWSATDDAAFELDFVGPSTDVRVFTTETSFVPSAEEWDWIATSNHGGAVSLSVRGIDAAGLVYRSQPVTLYFSALPVQGAFYYWADDTQGVMRASLAEASASKIYPDPGGPDAAKCAGCHSVSRDGKHLAAALGPELRVVALPSLADETPPDLGAAGAPATGPMMMPDKPPPPPAVWWTAFSPDASLLLVSASGRLTLSDAKTGAVLVPSSSMPIPASTIATHPDWSPLGDEIALTLATKGTDRNVEGGSIARMNFHDGTFDAPEILVPSAPGSDNNYYPAFSPDGRYLAFVGTNGKSQDSLGAAVRLLDLTSLRVIELPRLNGRVGAQDGVLDLANAMPTWAPATAPGLFWLTFSSLRPYASLRPLDKKSDQIWVAAIDPCLEDPSYAAFWAPFQSLDHSNHRAFWARSPGDTCSPVELCGDRIDNDCDGQADEADCVTGAGAGDECGGR
jgi:hypothetical protein